MKIHFELDRLPAWTARCLPGIHRYCDHNCPEPVHLAAILCALKRVQLAVD